MHNTPFVGTSGSMKQDITSQLKSLEQQIANCMLFQRHNFRRRLQKIKRHQHQPSASEDLTKLTVAVTQSLQLVEQRSLALPQPDYPQDLPVSQKKADILDAIRDHQVVIICGETGSGKTTQLPKMCLELGRGIHGMIGHTQPRRLAASSVAARIAEELK
ncbi:MAG TPA: ATP-dependent RNA helicase HrpA, partial [Gammaproteobacteria bacterium]